MCNDCRYYDPPREGYNDDVRTRHHVLNIADSFEGLPISDNDRWPVVRLIPVLPSARDHIVKALREYAKTLPET